MVFKDYYKILELETNKVNLEEIKTAYRGAAKKYHPDVNVGNSLAEERIKDINEAYRILSNPTTKRKYDRVWNSNVAKKKKAFQSKGKSSGARTNEFFYMFFGDVEEKEPKAKKKFPVKGENIETEIEASIEEAFYGLEKKIALKAIDESSKTLTVAIPAGIKNGERIRLIGQGKPGRDGGKNGDLFIKIKINNNKYLRLDGADLHTDLLITPWEAALGTRVEVHSIDAQTNVYIPQGTQTGELLRIPGKGYIDENGKRGDLVAEVKVMLPQKLTEQEKNLFEQLNKISKFNPRKA
jgi:curved DNA-binding protein